MQWQCLWPEDKTYKNINTRRSLGPSFLLHCWQIVIHFSLFRDSDPHSSQHFPYQKIVHIENITSYRGRFIIQTSKITCCTYIQQQTTASVTLIAHYFNEIYLSQRACNLKSFAEQLLLSVCSAAQWKHAGSCDVLTFPLYLLRATGLPLESFTS